MGTFAWDIPCPIGIFPLGTVACELSLGIFCLGTFVLQPELGNRHSNSYTWEFSLGIFRLNTFAWELPLGDFRLGSLLETSLGSFRFGSVGMTCFVRGLWLVIFRLVTFAFAWVFNLGTFAWELSLGNYRLRTCASGLQPGNFQLGTVAWRFSLGILGWEDILSEAKESVGLCQRRWVDRKLFMNIQKLNKNPLHQRTVRSPKLPRRDPN